MIIFFLNRRLLLYEPILNQRIKNLKAQIATFRNVIDNSICQSRNIDQADRVGNYFLSLNLKMSSPITISPNIQSGELVFTNTRVPIKNLFDYLKAGIR